MTPNGDAVLFLRSGPRDVSRNLYELDVATGQLRGLARPADLLVGSEEEITAEEKARRERQREIGKGFTSYTLSEDGRLVLAVLSGRLYLINRTDGSVKPLRDNPAGPAMDPKLSPDGRFAACIRGYDLYAIELENGAENAITTGGAEDVSHGVAEFVAQEEMNRQTGYWWSGDSQWLAFEECDQRAVETLFIADSRRPDAPPKGWRYPRAGGANARVRLGIVSVTGGEPRWAQWDQEKFPYLAAVCWKQEGPLTILVQSRDQREQVLYAADPLTGDATELLRETDAAWLNLDPDMPRWLPGGEEFLWTSERTGEWQLELRSRQGLLKRSYQPGESRLYGVVALDGERREVVVSGGTDPTQAQLYRLSLDSGEVVLLTKEPGTHDGAFARDGSVWVDKASLMDGSMRYTIRGRDATARGELPSVAVEPPFKSNLELTTVEAAGRTMHAAIIRPRNFAAARKYPVLVYVYGGPGHPVVTASSRSYLRQQWMADQGFIVVSLDGRGTPRRGREWERAIAGNFIDAPLDDQVAGLEALGSRYGELDLSRVGVYGWSFGGYFSAMAVCKRPDVFHAAVAGAPVIDWADYDTHYTERYLGLPQTSPEAYRVSNVLTYARHLGRPLLLIHGTTDDNVYFTHSLKMAEALFRAGRPYDLLVLPGFTHMVPEPEVTMRLNERIVRHFIDNLVTRTPASTN